MLKLTYSKCKGGSAWHLYFDLKQQGYDPQYLEGCPDSALAVGVEGSEFASFTHRSSPLI